MCVTVWRPEFPVENHNFNAILCSPDFQASTDYTKKSKCVPKLIGLSALVILFEVINQYNQNCEVYINIIIFNFKS